MKNLHISYSAAYDCPDACGWLSTRKARLVYEAACMASTVPSPLGFEFVMPELDALLPGDFSRAHDPEYVAAVINGTPRHLAESQGFKWSPALRDLIVATNVGQYEAALAALRDGVAGNLASGAHHATRSSGGGFCTFNYLVWVPMRLIEEKKIKRALILDLDTHQGNGTLDILGHAGLIGTTKSAFGIFDLGGSQFGVGEIRAWDTHRVHYDPSFGSPAYVIGFGVEGAHPAREDNLRRYLDAIASIEPELKEYDLVLYNSGMDAYEFDSMGGGVWGLDDAGVIRRERLVFEMCKRAGVPIVFNLAGGYNDDGSTVAQHMTTLREAARTLNLDGRQ